MSPLKTPIILMLFSLVFACRQTSNTKAVANKTQIAPSTTPSPNQNPTQVVKDTILFDTTKQLPSKTSLNISFTLGDGKTHQFYAHAGQYSEMDGTLFTEFSIDGSIFPETNHNYGNGPLTDGISLSYNSKALLNRPMELDPDKFFLQIAGESYTIHSGTLTIKSVNGNSVSGDFSTDMLTS